MKARKILVKTIFFILLSSVLSLSVYWASLFPENQKVFNSTIERFRYTPIMEECNLILNNVSPSSGPLNTILYLEGEGLSDIQSVWFGEVQSDAVTIQSDLSILVQIPSAAQTGDIRIVTACDTVEFGGFELLVSSSQQLISENTLLISEYGEEAGNDKYIELFNTGSAAVDLNRYTLKIAFNGGTEYDREINLSGELEGLSVFLITHSGATAAILDKADLSSGALSFNGDDFVGLFYEGVLIDAIGSLGEDPGTGWSASGVSRATKDHILVRRGWVQRGNPDWSVSSGENSTFSEWIVTEESDSSNLQEHFYSPKNLLISEYAESDGYNKYIELFNPFQDSLVLENYELVIHYQGSSSSASTIPLEGTIAGRSTWVVAHQSADAALLEKANQFAGNLRFNGDDFVGLYCSGELIDGVGRSGEDPGGSWDVAGVNAATKEQVLIRKARIGVGNTDWTISSGTTTDDSEWEVLTSNDFSDLGFHDPGKETYELINLEREAVVIECNGKSLINPNLEAVGEDQLVYEWYLSTDYAEFSLLTDDVSFQETDKQSLYIQDIDAFNGLQIYCKISDTLRGAEVYKKVIVPGQEVNKGESGTWYGMANSSWLNCLNWGDGTLPGPETDVMVSNERVLTITEDDTVYCNDLTINEAYLNLEKRSVIKVNGDFQVGKNSQVSGNTSGGEIHFTKGEHLIALDKESLDQKVSFLVEPEGVLHMQEGDLYLPHLTNSLTVDSGAVLNLSAYAILGDGNLTVNPHGKLVSAHAEGLSAEGNLQLNGNIALSSQGIYQFEESTLRTGKLLPDTVGSLIINLLPAQSMDLSKNLAVQSLVQMEEGFLWTQFNQIYLMEGAEIVGERGSSCIYGMVSSTSQIASGNQYQSEFGNVGFAIDASLNEQDLGSVTVTRYSGEEHAVKKGESQSINRRWQVEVENQPLEMVEVSFSWLAGDVIGLDLSEGQLWRREGAGEWERVGEMTDMSGRTVEASVGQFSEWTVANAAIELPVDLRYFTAQAEGDYALLNWQTYSESQNEGFEILRSYEGSDFEMVGYVDGAGNSKVINRYEFLDMPAETSVFYRLKQIDLDGHETLSSILRVNFASEKTATIQLYPNPADRSRINLVGSDSKENFKLLITDQMGRTMLKSSGKLGSLEEVINRKRKSLASGIYQVRFLTEEGEVINIPLIIR